MQRASDHLHFKRTPPSKLFFYWVSIGLFFATLIFMQDEVEREEVEVVRSVMYRK